MTMTEYGLLYPLVVCESNGGPYDDAAFVAGCWFGRIMAECRADRFSGSESWFVPSPLVPQIDLLAMNEGLVMTVEPWDECPDEWTNVTLVRGCTR